LKNSFIKKSFHDFLKRGFAAIIKGYYFISPALSGTFYKIAQRFYLLSQRPAQFKQLRGVWPCSPAKRFYGAWLKG
jgi:hypothetical protein